MAKARADVALVNRGLVESRAKAQALIMAGKVFSGEVRVDKSGTQIKDNAPLEVRGSDHPWVGRGGLKLDHAIQVFGLRSEGCTAIDVGSSTGGFTDVLLAYGATRVYAVDVGRGQLAWKLRNDPRVIVLEGVNARYLTEEQVPEKVSAIVCDASFIGLQTVLERPLQFADEGCWLAALIKPQFEVGREHIGKNGVVRDDVVRQACVDTIVDWLDKKDDWNVLGVTESPITGAEGNVEFVVAAAKT
jgi:23S rRNA (cytidine1920-2'-O)/16S rRNA (cytidine1409-2'-O)-methyltransferase